MLQITETNERQGRVGILPNITSAADAQETMNNIRNDWQSRGRDVITTSTGMIVAGAPGLEEIEYKVELSCAA